MSFATDRSSAKLEVEKLVRYFEQNVHQLKSPSFNEAQARQYLIDPFFEALGWDVRNKKMQPPYQLEVIPEGRVKTVGQMSPLVGRAGPSVQTEGEKTILEYIADDEYKADTRAATKKPDYRFRIQGSTKFFVEVKRPSVDLMNNTDAVFQIKRYGFSARVPVSILTDFEEFRVFDCTRKPFHDKPKAGVIKEFDLTYNVYLDEFDRLYDTFSRDAVVAGSLEGLQKKYLEKRTGEFALDRVFLDDLSQWRVELAQDVAKHPKNRRILNTYTLNECVQRILDRIVFLRVCEDRTIEETGTLLALLRLWQDHPGLSLYEQFNKLIVTRRSLYNGLLFTEHECEQLEVGNKVLEKVFKNINYPLSPYNFDEIGVEILGSIYERFLGKTIRLTKKQVRVEEKPEVRKAGGVYYTPQYIVNYIVENTVGKLLYEEITDESPLLSGEGKGEVSKSKTPPQSSSKSGGSVARKLKLTPKQIEKLKIIDIACGSGSFLLGAFQKLTDYHVEWYTQHPEDIKEVHGARDAYEDQQGQLHLSARKKREILVNNIYGVDIDQQAMEVTQMSLYLKVLENENDATLNKPTMLALHEVLLPPLKNNIKCGNSLIGTDFFAQGELFDEETRRKVNPFDWEMEFPEILLPSPRKESLPLSGGEKEEVSTRKNEYETPPQSSPKRGGSDSGGFDCVIGNPPYGMVSDEIQKTYFARAFETTEGRFDTFELFIERAMKLLKAGGSLGYIIPSPLLSNLYSRKLRQYLLENHSVREIVNFGIDVFDDPTIHTCIMIVISGANKKNQVAVKKQILKIGDLSQSPDYVISQQKLGRNEYATIDIFVDPDSIQIIEKLSPISKPLGEICFIRQCIKTGDDDLYLKSSKAKLKGPWKPTLRGRSIDRYLTIEKDLYLKYGDWLARNWKNKSFYETPKIAIRETGNRITATIDTENRYFLSSLYAIYPKSDNGQPSLNYLLAILNSRLATYFVKKIAFELTKGAFTKIRTNQLARLPIRTIDFTKPEEKQMHDELVALVDRMLNLHKQLQKVNFESEKEPIERQIAATDKKIDKLVYKLYGLTDQEINIMENSR